MGNESNAQLATRTGVNECLTSLVWRMLRSLQVKDNLQQLHITNSLPRVVVVGLFVLIIIYVSTLIY